MSASRAAVGRDVEIAPPSARDELVTVVRLAVAVLFGMWLYVASQPGDAGSSGARKGLLPYQAVVLDRPPDEQRMFRALQVGLLEAENVRSISGAWPSVDAMAAEGIEPFAPDPTYRGDQYRWQFYKDAFRLAYVGVPVRPEALVWLLFVQEPDPSVAPEPFQNDEEHHRLVDGLVLHVSTWTRPLSRGAPTSLPRSPQGEGWSQLFAVGPSVTH